MMATHAELLSNPRTRSIEPDSTDPAAEQRSSDSNSARSSIIGKGTQARRQSKILSLSTLHRPAFPLKLDLSSAALRFVPDEITRSAITSPVTLAPKSARPTTANELPPDLLAAFTANTGEPSYTTGLGDSTQGPGLTSGQNPIQVELGTTAEQPIELDLDMDVGMSDLDLFGDNVDTGGNLGNQSALFNANTQLPEVPTTSTDMGLLDAYNAVGGHEEAIFGSLGTTMGGATGPSSSILADLASGNTNIEVHSENPGVNASSFDYQSLGMDDISNFNSSFFNSADGSMEMNEFLSMGTAGQSSTNKDYSNDKLK